MNGTTPLKIGILHPGAMGISIAVSMQNSGHEVYWVSDGRSADSHQRAEQHNLLDAGTLTDLCGICSAIVSVCPPGNAEEVADEVLALGFKGTYVDANAIAPQRAIHIGEKMAQHGVTFVDGSIIGGPAWEAGRTWLYLSGEDADSVTGYFSAGPLETEVISTQIGKASALKMCFAAHTKGATALLCAVMGLAESLGVRDDLERQWTRNDDKATARNHQQTRGVTAKAWRFVGEMDEIADTFDGAGFPDGFHRAAGDIYRRMAEFKDAPELPDLLDVLEALQNRVKS